MQRISKPSTISTFVLSASNGRTAYSRRVRPERSLQFFVLAMCLGCGPTLPHVPTFPAAEDGFHAVPIEIPPGLTMDLPPALVVLPGDTLRLQILSAENNQSTELWVDATGRVHVPFGGDVDVAGLSLNDAEERVELAVRHYDKYARVALTMLSFDGHKASVHGAVDKPDRYEARPGTRLADIVHKAGGIRVSQANGDLSDAADLEAARLIRAGKTVPVSVKLALFGEPLHNIYVHPGDIIFVPWATSRQIPVLGDVRTARNVPFRNGLRLTEALAAAGGPTRTADTADIRIVRGPLSKAKVYRANLDDVISGARTDVVLAPGDVIYVSEHWFATTTDVISRLTPLVAAATIYPLLAR
jgi:polysaccharide biosynthesis/export protein